MVKIDTGDDYTKLEHIIRQICEKHKLQLNITGWSCKTFDLLKPIDPAGRRKKIVAQLRSLTMKNGEIYIFTDEQPVLDAIKELAEAIERNFSIPEAVIIKKETPFTY